MGAFIKSPLGARGSAALGIWFYLNSSPSQLYQSADGITFANSGITAFGPIDIIDGVVTGRGVILVSPYGSSDYQTGSNGGSLFGKIVRVGSRYICSSSSESVANNIRYSTDLKNWTTATMPLSPSGAAYEYCVSNILCTTGGTLYALLQRTSGSPDYTWLVTSTDGVTWTSTGYERTTARANHVLFERSNGDIVFTDVSGTIDVKVSSDGGATFSTGNTIPSGFGIRKTGVLNRFNSAVTKHNDDIFVFSPNDATKKSLYVIRGDGTSSSDYEEYADCGVGFVAASGVYYVKATDSKLYRASLDMTTESLIVTSPSTLGLATDTSRIVAVGMT